MARTKRGRRTAGGRYRKSSGARGRSVSSPAGTAKGEDPSWRPETRFIHAAQPPDPATGAVVAPVHMATTFAQEAPGQHKGYDYSRTVNPTRLILEKAMASIEGGAWAGAFASGMAATDTLLRLLKPGDHVVAGEDLYGGTVRLFNKVLADYGLRFTYVNTSDPAALQNALEEDTRLLWLETPTNPTLALCDLRELSAIAHRWGARVAVDNTFASPALQLPIALGADFVVHSATKYLGGHSDVVGGVLVAKDAAAGERLHYLQNAVGGILDPWSSFLLLRGLKTLHVRMERHCANAQRIAEHLRDHKKVLRVLYPGLPGHPGHELAKRQMKGFGGMVSVELKGGLGAAKRALKEFRLWTLAESLGAVESLINHPVSMTHGSVPKAQRERAGVTEGLFRLSVGIENVEDLIEDLERGLRKA